MFFLVHIKLQVRPALQLGGVNQCVFTFKSRKSIIVPLNNLCVCVCVKNCLCNKEDLAQSIWLLCQSYFHSLVDARVVKLISNVPCVPIVLNLQLLKHNEQSKKVEKMCGQHIILFSLSFLHSRFV